MTYNPDIHHRRSVRLKGYNYSQDGVYFVTICTQHKECLFGEIVDGKMVLNDAGEVAHRELQNTEKIRKNVFLDCFTVMPNHIHVIVRIDKPVGAYCNTPLPARGKFRSPSNNLGAVIRGYKSTVTKQINEHRDTPGCPVWQRNYHEHIIRNEVSYEKIYDYILHNAERWEDDGFFVG